MFCEEAMLALMVSFTSKIDETRGPSKKLIREIREAVTSTCDEIVYGGSMAVQMRPCRYSNPWRKVPGFGISEGK